MNYDELNWRCRVIEEGKVGDIHYVLLKSKKDATTFCKTYGINVDGIEELDNGFFRVRTDNDN